MKVAFAAGAEPVGSPLIAKEQGGGELEGGLLLVRPFVVDVGDPNLPYRLSLTVGAHRGRLVVEQAVISRRENDEPVNAIGLRKVAIESYLQRALQELRETHGFPVVSRTITGRGSRVTGNSFASAKEWPRSEGIRPRRRSPSELLPMVAQVYRAALLDPDPAVARRPSVEVGRRLHKSRTHAARLVAMARKEGLLGPARPGRAGEHVRTEGTTA